MNVLVTTMISGIGIGKKSGGDITEIWQENARRESSESNIPLCTESRRESIRDDGMLYFPFFCYHAGGVFPFSTALAILA